MPEQPSSLKRALVPMPTDVRSTLAAGRLNDAYAARPPYQRNDYLARIERAVRAETRQKRLDQMIRELEAGHGYMSMDWRHR